MRSNWFAVVAGAETGLLLLLLLIAAWQFWAWGAPPGEFDEPVASTLADRMPAFSTSHLLIGLLAVAGCYGVLQLLGRSAFALWMLTFLILISQMPAVWSHNRLVWERFMGVETPVGTGHFLLMAGVLFVLSLVGLVVLHRLIALRKLGRLLAARRVDGAERDMILTSEAATMGGVVAVTLVVAVLLVLGGAGLSRADWLTNAVPWTVVTIGGGASLLLLGFIAVFLRALGEQEEPEATPEAAPEE